MTEDKVLQAPLHEAMPSPNSNRANKWVIGVTAVVSCALGALLGYYALAKPDINHLRYEKSNLNGQVEQLVSETVSLRYNLDLERKTAKAEAEKLKGDLARSNENLASSTYLADSLKEWDLRGMSAENLLYLATAEQAAGLLLGVASLTPEDISDKCTNPENEQVDEACVKQVYASVVEAAAEMVKARGAEFYRELGASLGFQATPAAELSLEQQLFKDYICSKGEGGLILETKNAVEQFMPGFNEYLGILASKRLNDAQIVQARIYLGEVVEQIISPLEKQLDAEELNDARRSVVKYYCRRTVEKLVASVDELLTIKNLSDAQLNQARDYARKVVAANFQSEGAGTVTISFGDKCYK